MYNSVQHHSTISPGLPSFQDEAQDDLVPYQNCQPAGRLDCGHTFADLRSVSRARKRARDDREKYHGYESLNRGQIGRLHYANDSLCNGVILSEVRVEVMTPGRLYHQAQISPKPFSLRRGTGYRMPSRRKQRRTEKKSSRIFADRDLEVGRNLETQNLAQGKAGRYFQVWEETDWYEDMEAWENGEARLERTIGQHERVSIAALAGLDVLEEQVLLGGAGAHSSHELNDVLDGESHVCGDMIDYESGCNGQEALWDEVVVSLDSDYASNSSEEDEDDLADYCLVFDTEDDLDWELTSCDDAFARDEMLVESDRSDNEIGGWEFVK